MNNVSQNSKRTRKGFTLIELLVSMVLLVLIMGIVGTSFTSIVRAQKDTNEIRKMYADVLGFVEMFSAEARLGSIDYRCYVIPVSIGNATNSRANSNDCPQILGPIVNGRSNYLALTRQDGMEKTIFKYDPRAKKVLMIKFEKTEGGGWKYASGYTDFRDAIGSAVSVEKLSFVINPDVDPYAQANYGINAKQFQPEVTLYMTVKNANSSKSAFSMDFQTTISSRVYSR
jgi:prepilin-type N-terminal cleavage/methylation domain-containing protein